jgi:hypothetical protein
MSNTLTILNSGTCYSFMSKDIIGDLARNQLNSVNYLGRNGSVLNSWILNAGPGGGRKEVDMPGTYDYYIGNIKTFTSLPKGKLSLGQKEIDVNLLNWIKNKTSQIMGPIDGLGMEFNVKKAIQAIEYILTHPTRQALTKVVLVGYSRGAVTCHMISHAIYNYKSKDNYLSKEFSKLKVSMFVFDPVAGGDPNISKAYNDYRRLTVAKNVVKYFVIYCAHDTRFYYKPVQINKGEIAKFESIVMPGQHTTMVNETNNTVPEVMLISKALCHEFLIGEGLKLHSPYKLTPFKMLKLYDAILGSDQEVKKLRGGDVNLWLSLNPKTNIKRFGENIKKTIGRGGFYVQRGFDQNKGKDYLVNEHFSYILEKLLKIKGKSSAIFVNHHHEKLFRRFFPIGLPWREHHFILLEDLPNTSLRLKIAQKYSKAISEKDKNRLRRTYSRS